jgi:hypothetical protein
MQTYYTYLWLREDGTPCYVGKGSGERAYRKGSPPRDRVLIQPHPSEEDAFAAEIFLIAYYGRKDIETGVLINHTDGGDGASGNRRSEKTRRLLSLQKMGNQNGCGPRRFPRSPEHREKLAATRRGKINSLESNLKRSTTIKGQKRSAEQRRNMSLAQMGNKKGLGKHPSPEAIRKRVATRMKSGGFSPSEETRLKISESLKRRSAARKIA